MTDIKPPETSKYSNLFIVRLIKGEIPLVITYWVFGVIGCGLLMFINNFFIANSMSIIHSGYGLVITLYKWFVYLYVIIVWIAIWRSANKYKGFLWGTAAQVMVVIGIINFIAYSLNDEKYKVRMEMAEMNKSLPITIEPGIELVSITSDDNTINYNYRFINANLTEEQTLELKAKLKYNLKQQACTDKDSFEMLKVFGNAHYIYADEQGNNVIDIPISINDCSLN